MNPFYRFSDAELEKARKTISDKMETPEVAEDYMEYYRLYQQIQDILTIMEEREETTDEN